MNLPSTPTLICLLIATQLHAQTPVSAPDFAETRRLIAEGMAKDSVPAAAIAVLKDGKIIWEEGFGWATPFTPFQLASLAKTFEATLALVLHQQHRLDLDTPVNDYLRTTAVSSPVGDPRGVTLRSLLRHTAGLSTFNIWCDPSQPCRFPSADETISRYGVVAGPPGYFDYSNLGFFVAGITMGRAAGRPLRDLLRDEVFRPLGMMNASLGLHQLSPPGELDYAHSTGFASAHDLALFAAFHLKTRRPDQRAILPDADIDLMQDSIVPTGQRDGEGYGLGWWTEENRFGYRSVLAQGGNNLAQAWLRLIPSERVAVAVLFNKGIGFGEAVTDAALAAVLPRYGEALRARSTPAAPPTAPIPLDSTIVGSWRGRVRTADQEIPLELTIAATGAVQALIGTRSDTGRARLSTITPGMLIVRLSGDLETSSPPGLNRLTRFYLRPRETGFGGVVTTRPPTASGLDGSVSYWAEIGRP